MTIVDRHLALGDRSHISAEAQPIFDILAADMARIKSKAPATYAPQVNDTEKRLNILFDHLNNDDLLKPDTVQEMVGISQSIKARDFGRATDILTEMMKTKLESEGGNWMVSCNEYEKCWEGQKLTLCTGRSQASDCHESSDTIVRGSLVTRTC